jgi:glycosyltransferase involved in cell wall biosynthesis
MTAEKRIEMGSTSRPQQGAQPGHIRASRSLREHADTPRVIDDAIAEFRRMYDGEDLPPLIVVITALNEEPCIGPVIDEIPDTIAGVKARTLVIDDGSTDETSKRSDEHGALVCRLRVNCGQGTAVRTGYRIARESGARYVATLDADGQWDPKDLPAMIELLEADRADLVLGSRQLGRTESSDAVRNLGVRFFSRVVSLLTRTKVTDTSSGLRAMRVEVATTVRQTQPQYQSAEFLIGAILQGFRVAEVPTVMRLRGAGESKKGRNAFYGLRYGTVVARTFLREWPRRARIFRRA